MRKAGYIGNLSEIIEDLLNLGKMAKFKKFFKSLKIEIFKILEISVSFQNLSSL